MSVDDMYPANQWRHHHHRRHRDRPHHNDSYSEPHPHYNRPPPPRYPGWRRRQSTPMLIGPVGPRLGMLGIMSLFNASNSNNNHHSRRQSQPNYPASPYNNAPAPNPVIVDILKQGFLEIEYNVIFKYYRNKYFVLKSDSKLYYFDSPNHIHQKPDGVINLLHVISLKKMDKLMFEMEINNKTDTGPPVDLVKLLTPDTTKWKFKCNSMNVRNDWFDCIRCFVSQNKNTVYIEREQKQHEDDMDENKDDEWCFVEKKDDGIFSKILHKKKQNDNGLDLDVTAPEQPGMIANNAENNGYIAPPAYAPEYMKEYGNLNNKEGNNGNAQNEMDYGDEGKATYQ